MSEKLNEIFIRHFERKLKECEIGVRDCKKVLKKLKSLRKDEK